MWHRKKLTNDIKGKKGERYFKDNLTAYSRSPTVWLHNLKYLTYWDPPFGFYDFANRNLSHEQSINCDFCL